MTSTSSSSRAPPPAPSHSAFILSQVRSGLAHLKASRSIDVLTYEQIEKLLSSAELHEGQTRVTAAGVIEEKVETEEQRLGKRNAWLRETLTDTSLLPTLVDTAMQVAVPSAILGSMQREAIVQLVERSQKAIARAVTDPKHQQRVGSGAWGSAKGAHTGLLRAKNIAGQGLQDIAQKRQDAKQRSEEKRKEKREEKAMKKELKREREEIRRRRQAELSGEDGNGGRDGVTSDRFFSGSSSNDFVRSPTALTMVSSRGASATNAAKDVRDASSEEDDDDDDESDFDSDEEGQAGLHAEGGAMATVSCGRIDDEDGGVGSTMTFSPWPGLLLCSTVVAISDEPIGSAKDIEWTRNEQARKRSEQQQPPAVQRHALPPPPPPSSKPAADTLASGHAARSTPQRPSDATATPKQPIAPPTASQSTSVPAARGSLAASQTSNVSTPRLQTTTQNTQPERTEVKDVTESKQKSWTRKLGL